MFGQNNTNAIRYAIYRTHLAEKHAKALYAYLIEKFPEDREFLESHLSDWQEEVSALHNAFLSGDTHYLDNYEKRFS